MASVPSCDFTVPPADLSEGRRFRQLETFEPGAAATDAAHVRTTSPLTGKPLSHWRARELQEAASLLPAARAAAQIRESVVQFPVTLIEGSTGSGKSTQTTQVLLELRRDWKLGYNFLAQVCPIIEPLADLHRRLEDEMDAKNAIHLATDGTGCDRALQMAQDAYGFASHMLKSSSPAPPPPTPAPTSPTRHGPTPTESGPARPPPGVYVQQGLNGPSSSGLRGSTAEAGSMHNGHPSPSPSVPPPKPKAPPPTLSQWKEHLRRELEKDRVDDTTQPHYATPRPTDFPPTTAPTGPFTAEAGTNTNPADEHIQHSYSAGDVGVVLCRSLTDSGCHILTTWLCANIGYDFYSDAQSTYLVLCQVGMQILQRCEPLRKHRRPLVVLGGNGAEWGFDNVYGLSANGLQQLIDTDCGRSVNPLALAVSGTIRDYGYAAVPPTQHATSPPCARLAPAADAPSTTAAGAGQPALQRPAVVVVDNSTAIWCSDCTMQLNGKRQFASHLKGPKHQSRARRNLRLELASLCWAQPVQNAAVRGDISSQECRRSQI
jgi:hypothetical protein